MNKYRNIKTEVDGIVFDSRKEARRYQELKLLERAGKISNIELQPKYRLLDGFEDSKGKIHRPIDYKADFRYIEDGKTVVEDVKGRPTPVYKIKKKLLLYNYRDINFYEV